MSEHTPADPPAEARRLAGPGFAGDTGEADPAVTRALAELEAGTGGYPAALAALVRSRLLVPVVAVLGEVEYDDTPDGRSLAHDKTSDMATVLLTGADGRRALLAFTSMDTLRAWQADARPVPVSARDAARAAVQDGAEALVVDLAGPVRFVVEGPDLIAVAEGWQLVLLADDAAGDTSGNTTGAAWIRPGEE